MNWVEIKKLSEMSGLSEHSIRALTKKGIWIQDKHWKKPLKHKRSRIFFNVKEIEKWIEGSPA